MTNSFIRYNKILGKQASIGPVPANQLVPWIGIIVVSYVVIQGFLGLGLPTFFATAFVLIVSWWLLTGKRPYHYLNQWRNPPGKDWCNGHKRYIAVLSRNRTAQAQRLYQDKIARPRLKPRQVKRDTGGKWTFMPFQNYLNLCCLAEIHKDGRTISAYLLELGARQYQFVFGFTLQGWHDILTQEELMSAAAGLEEGFKYLPPGERLTFCMSGLTDDHPRQSHLEDLADNASNSAVSVLLRNEQNRVRDLAQSGQRQCWDQRVFVTWTASAGEVRPTGDWWDKCLGAVQDMVGSVLGNITGNTLAYKEQYYTRLLLAAFNQGFLPWESVLNTKAGLALTPCSTDDLWDWLWHRFNDTAAPPVPQVLSLRETDTGYHLQENISTPKHPVTLLIEGSQGRSACPSHGELTDGIKLPGKARPYVGVMVMEEAPAGWANLREQLRWMWKCSSAGFVYDSEVWCEVTTASDLLIKDNLAKQAKQARSASSRSLQKGQGRDAGAEVKQNESFQAQLELYQGVKAVHCAPVMLVYRKSLRELDLACQMLANAFDSAVVIRENHVAWELWLQSLPITCSRLLQDGSLVSDERRLTPTTQTVAGLLPLTLPRSLDRRGVEFITARGGKPLHIDLFTQAKRALITGTSGSGKSVLACRFLIDSLAQNIPVVGMDLSSGGDSTFKTLIGLLGRDGAYIDMKHSHSNLLEPPDLRHFDKATRQQRLETWKEMVLWPLNIIVMGKLDDPPLAQRVEALLRLALENFLGDSDIVERYNQAMAEGWPSEAWQHIPTLKDFKRYCTRERLNLVSFEDLDKRALNQIVTQFEALFVSEVGRVLSEPSSFNPNPAVTFFALSGLNAESGQDAYLMAINAHAACIRTALAHPRSLFVGDEQSVLLKRDGFAQMVGDLCATGRKDGISVLLIAQDPDAIADCSTSAQILQNLNYKIMGRITSAAVASFERHLGYPAGIVSANAGDTAKPRPTDLSTYWVLEQDDRFWPCRYYPGEMMLASVANGQSEQALRAYVMAQYPDTFTGRLQGLADFTHRYIPALKSGVDLMALLPPEVAAGVVQAQPIKPQDSPTQSSTRVQIVEGAPHSSQPVASR